MKTIRIGILGTGGVADGHARALAKLPGVQLVGLCNHHLEKAQAFNQKHGNTARCFADFQQMLNTVEMDALYVCLPPGAHNGQTEVAAQRGLHLFLEKPIALDLARGESIARAVRKAGVKCQIGHHLRHCLPVRKLKQMISDGTAGRPLFMQGRWFCNALHPQWWQDPKVGGGQLIEQAIHVYDLARHFMGNVASVSGMAARLGHQRFPAYQVDDASAAVIGFGSGGMASICAANLAEPGKWVTQATILCEKVMVELQAPERATFIYHQGKVAEEMGSGQVEIRREEVVNDVDCCEEINRNFVAAIRDRELLRSGIEDGWEGLRLVTAVAQSSAAGGAVQKP